MGRGRHLPDGAQGGNIRVAAMRFRDVKGTPVLTPWADHFGDSQRVAETMIPMSGAVVWIFPDGPIRTGVAASSPPTMSSRPPQRLRPQLRRRRGFPYDASA